MRHASRFPRLARFTALAVSVSALLSAGSAMAVENLYGGGSTFAATPYVGTGYLANTPTSRLSTNAGNTAGPGFTTAGVSTGSTFDVFSSTTLNQISYCQTGSGFGKNSLNGVATALANGQCNDFSTSPVGLSAPTATPDFIGTDSPYSTVDYNAFLSGPQFATHTGVMQIPTLAGAIALPHNATVSNVVLRTSYVCKVYSGLYRAWNQIPGVTGTGSKKPIGIIYRSDSSGTSFAFTRYLAANCNGTPYVPAGFVFTPSSTFNSALPGGVAAVFGTHAVGASGNAGVVQATLNAANPNSMGYADIGEVLNQAAPYATVDGFDPAQFGLVGGVPTPISIALGNLVSGMVQDGATLNPVPGASAQQVKNCVRVLNPAIKISSTYPIVAVTYLAGNYSGNQSLAHRDALKNLYNLYYNHATRPVLPTGFAYLDGVAIFGTSVKNTVNACTKL